MKCKKCQSEKLLIVRSGPHKKLVCKDCLGFIKFLSNADVKVFKQIQATNNAIQPTDDVEM